MATKKNKENEEEIPKRALIDHTHLIGREDALVFFGDDNKILTKKTKDEYYSSKDPKYWIDCEILAYWLQKAKPPGYIKFCADPNIMNRYRLINEKENPGFIFSADEAVRYIHDLWPVSLESDKPNMVSREFKRINQFLNVLLNAFTYKRRDQQPVNYFFRTMNERNRFQYLTGKYIALYNTLCKKQKQMHSKIDLMKRRPKEREKLLYQFGAILKVTYRKNDILLKTLCRKIHELVDQLPSKRKIVNIVPYILCKTNVLRSAPTHAKCEYKNSKRQLCSKSSCLNYRVATCIRQYMSEWSLDRDDCVKECNTYRPRLCRGCENRMKSPFKEFCYQGRRRYEYLIS
jgi:hypothetical protein